MASPETDNPADRAKRPTNVSDVDESPQPATRRKPRPLMDSISFAISIILPTIVIALLPLGFFLFFNEDGELKRFVQRAQIESQLITALSNDADLRSIKNIYENRNLGLKRLPDYLSISDRVYYDASVPLSKILENIRSGYFLGEVQQTPIDKLDAVITEHNQVNPFDALENYQKDSFENIRIELGQNYDMITPEMGKIVGDLSEKNALVGKYLANATLSFWISIGAVVLALAFGLAQLFIAVSGNRRISFLNQRFAALQASEAKTSSKAAQLLETVKEAHAVDSPT